MPVSAAQFRKLALSFPETEERSHMNHPDFRVAGRIFATLSYPNKGFGMVKLTPEQQEELVHDQPDAFNPCSGVWGLRGATNVQLKSVKQATLRRALEAAYRNTLSALSQKTKARKPRAN
jgi:predicted DNA-binding protein (MmcQ/YjbR family)